MASACRTKRKTQLPKRRKQTASKKTQRRKLLPKPKKPQLKQRTVPVSSKPNLKRPCDEFISKILRQLSRDKVPISTKAKGKMISFIRKFYNRVSAQAKRSKKFKRSCTVGTKELQNALKRVMRKKDVMELVRTIRKVSGHRRQ